MPCLSLCWWRRRVTGESLEWSQGAVSLGGDTDTIASIAGQVVGATGCNLPAELLSAVTEITQMRPLLDRFCRAIACAGPEFGSRVKRAPVAQSARDRPGDRFLLARHDRLSAIRGDSRMWQTRQLILHGGIVLLLGYLSGAGLGSAVNRGKSEATLRAWRVAHSGIVMGGVLLRSRPRDTPSASWRIGPRRAGLGLRGVELCVCDRAPSWRVRRLSGTLTGSAIPESRGLRREHHRRRGSPGWHSAPRVGRICRAVAIRRPFSGTKAWLKP